MWRKYFTPFIIISIKIIKIIICLIQILNYSKGLFKGNWCFSNLEMLYCLWFYISEVAFCGHFVILYKKENCDI